MPSPNDVITASDLKKSFKSRRGPVEAVRGVSISVERGEIFGFLGPNGAGKTTTLRMLTTLLPIDSGSATVSGFDVARQPQEVRAHTGFVSQLGGADPFATGIENLLLQGRLYGHHKQEVMKRSEELMDILDLREFATRKVITYSGGQRRRLDIALGIVHQPDVLFLDEPTTGLDPQNRANLWEHIGALRDRGTTVFLTTHYLEEADALCDRLVIMDHGQVVIGGTPKELKHQVAGDAVVLTLRDHTPEEVAKLAKRESYVRESSIDNPTTLRLYVEDGPTALPPLLRLLDGAGIALAAMSLSEPTLDDVFLNQTGRSLRDTGDSGSSPKPQKVN
jgi:ABC-2 type transport system ATP-binding protein